jgi:hypothetical protein
MDDAERRRYEQQIATQRSYIHRLRRQNTGMAVLLAQHGLLPIDEELNSLRDDRED